MTDDHYIKRTDLEASHSAIAKTVSAYGDAISKNNNEIIDLKRLVKDYIEKADSMLIKHDDSINTLKTSDTEIRSTFKGAVWIGSVLIGAIMVMGGFIVTEWSSNYDDRLKKIEEERTQTLDKVLQMLSDKKNYLNYQEKELIKDIFANL